MEFKPKNSKHQFSEVDEDLRRIGEREASKTLCKYGNNCYRKDPNHWQQYKHIADSGAANRAKARDRDNSAVKRGKITDFFHRKPISGKKCIERPTDESDYEIEDSEEEVNNSSINWSKDRPNTSLSTETPPKKKKFSPFKAKSNSKTKTNSNRKKTLNRSKAKDNGSDNDFDEELKSLIKDDNNVSELNPKKLNFNFNEISCSSKGLNKDSINDKNAKKMNELFGKSMANRKTIVNKSNEQKPKMTPKELNELLRDIFLVEMPKDFFLLWQFCKTLKPERPEDALVEGLGLRLVGPYDVLTGKVKKDLIKDREQILCHWRYFYDLPEFQTTIASIKSGYHLGYFRDTPEEENPVVVSNNGDNCVIEGMGDNIFAAIYSVIQKHKSKDSSNKTLTELESKLKEFCNKNKIIFNEKTKLMSRKSKIIAKTFNGFGFIVPYDKKKDVGYRPLPHTDSDLKKLLNSIVKVDEDMRNECKSLSELQEVIQLVSYATDECDFGMGLELAIDLFAFGHQFFHKSVLYLLPIAYDLLKREVFSRIIKAHINNRRKGFNLSSIQ